MPSYESLVIVGPPKSGMSTIVNGLRGAEFADSLVIPRLYIAREHNDGVLEVHLATLTVGKVS